MPVKPPKALLADKGYDGDALRETLLLHNILPVIPSKASRREAATCDYHAIATEITSSVCSIA